MPNGPDDHAPLSRHLRDALDGAIDEHTAARDGLRTAVCAYYDAQHSLGHSRAKITIMIQDIFASMAPPAGAKVPMIAKRKQLLDDMIASCADGRSV